MLDLEAIKARVSAATPAPWIQWEEENSLTSVIHFDEGRGDVANTYRFCDSDTPHQRRAVEDAEFIAHARQDVPALVAEVERLREAIDVHRAFCQAKYGAAVQPFDLVLWANLANLTGSASSEIEPTGEEGK